MLTHGTFTLLGIRTDGLTDQAKTSRVPYATYLLYGTKNSKLLFLVGRKVGVEK